MKKIILLAFTLNALSLQGQFTEGFLHYDWNLEVIESCQDSEGQINVFVNQSEGGKLINLDEDSTLTNYEYRLYKPKRDQVSDCNLIFQKLQFADLEYSGVADFSPSNHSIVYNPYLTFNDNLGYIETFHKLSDSLYFASGRKRLGLLNGPKSMLKQWEYPFAVFFKKDNEIYMISDSNLYRFDEVVTDFNEVSTLDYDFDNKDLRYDESRNSVFAHHFSKSLEEFVWIDSSLYLLNAHFLESRPKKYVIKNGKLYYISGSDNEVIKEYDFATREERIFHQNEFEVGFKTLSSSGSDLIVSSQIATPTGGRLPIVQRIDSIGQSMNDRIDLVFKNLSVEDSIIRIYDEGPTLSSIYALLNIDFDIENLSEKDTINYFDLHHDLLFVHPFFRFNKVIRFQTNIPPGGIQHFELVDSFLVNDDSKVYTFGVPGANSKYDDRSEDNYLTTHLSLNANELLLDEVSLYPNPSDDLITIDFKELPVDHIQIMDGLGIQLKDYKVVNDQLILNVVQYPSGKYVVKMYDQNRKLIGVRSFVKL